MRDKKKLAIAWFGACAGCDESILDINEELLALADAFEIVLWPVAFDYKYEQIEHLRDGELALALISGSVRNSEHEELAHLLRRKSLNLVAFGACACFGGTPGLANMVTREDIFATAYHDAPTVVNPLGIEPEPQSVIHGKELSLPVFYNEVHPLNAIIEVDYYLPGCPPPPPLISAMISAFLNGKLPQRGSTLAPDTALCEVCPRNATKPQRLVIQNLRRIHEGPVDAEQCFLAQGIVCVGPATRQGCGSPCMKVNMPCRGCFGPVEGVSDMGTAFVSSIASLLESGENGAGSVPDPAGYFYRFTTATSILGKRRSTVSRQNEGVTQWKE
jgi:F420-non-reducing hydrogenase small subunit